MSKITRIFPPNVHSKNFGVKKNWFFPGRNVWHPNIFVYLFGTWCGIQMYSDICSCPFYDIRSSLMTCVPATMCVKGWFQKFDLRILKSVTCLGFSNIEEFYQGWNFGYFWWNFSNINPICCTYQNHCMTFMNVFFSSFFKSIFLHHEQVFVECEGQITVLICIFIQAFKTVLQSLL